MFIKFFRNLQRKPTDVRNKYAFAFAFAFTGVVALVWFSGLVSQGSFLGPEMASEDSKKPSPFSNLIKQSKEQLANIKGTKQDENPASVTEGEESNKDEAQATNTNPLNMMLTQEDIDLAKENQSSSTTTYFSEISTSTIQNRPMPREVMIATTTSSSTKKQLETKPNDSNI